MPLLTSAPWVCGSLTPWVDFTNRVDFCRSAAGSRPGRKRWGAGSGSSCGALFGRSVGRPPEKCRQNSGVYAGGERKGGTEVSKKTIFDFVFVQRESCRGGVDILFLASYRFIFGDRIVVRIVEVLADQSFLGVWKIWMSVFLDS